MGSGKLRACCCPPPCCQCHLTIGTAIDGVSGSGSNLTIGVSPADCSGLPAGGQFTIAANTTAAALCFSRDAQIVVAVPNVVSKGGNPYYFSRWTVSGCVGNTDDYPSTDGDGNRLYYGLTLPIDTCAEGDCDITATAHYAYVSAFPCATTCPVGAAPPLNVAFATLQTPTNYLSYPNETAYVEAFLQRCLGTSSAPASLRYIPYLNSVACGWWAEELASSYSNPGLEAPCCDGRSPDFGSFPAFCYQPGSGWSIPGVTACLVGWSAILSASPSCDSLTGILSVASIHCRLYHKASLLTYKPNCWPEEGCVYPPTKIGRGTVDMNLPVAYSAGPFATAQAYAAAYRAAFVREYQFPYGAQDWGELLIVS